MKTISNLLFVLLASLLVHSCTDDKSMSEFDEQALPKIYMSGWPSAITATVGDVLSYSPLVSPSEGASYAWTIDDEVISTERELAYTLPTEGTFTLKFEVNRFNVSTFRKASLKVNKAIIPEPPFEPEAFTPKSYVTKAIGFFDVEMGDPTTIAWDNITHLVLSSALVQADGTVQYPFGGAEKEVRDIVNRAHSNGVYVMLQVAGEHDPIQGKNVYNSFNFYNVAIDNTRNDRFIENLYAYVNKNGLDGINVFMDKAIQSSVGYPEADKLVAFYQKMAAAKPAQSLTGHEFYLTMNLINGALTTRGCQDSFVGLDGWDWYYVMVFGIENKSVTSHAPQQQLKDELIYWIETKGHPKEKFVIVISAIAIVYDYSLVGGKDKVTDSNVSQCTDFIKYSELFTMFPELDVANLNNLDKYTMQYDGIRYDGLPWVGTKIGYFNNPGAGGIALWKIDFDTQNPSTSMMHYIKTRLGNP